VESGEPVLLVGETGVGKTASVQFLAQQTGRSDSTYVSDLDPLHPHGSH
jgi:MoxR-like ATPase